MMVLRARGGRQRYGPGDGGSQWCHGSGMPLGAQRRGFGEDDVVACSGTASQAWGWHLRGRRCHRLGSGKMAARKGARSWSAMMAQRLRGGLDDDTGLGEVDDGTGSREIFSGKFWQPDGVSESLRGLWFAKAVHQFIYRGATVTMCIGHISRAVAIVIHISIAPLRSRTHKYLYYMHQIIFYI
jgi:hypothetical protein